MKRGNAIVMRPGGGPFDEAQAAMVMRGLGCEAEVLPVERDGLTELLAREGRRFARIFVINVVFRGDAAQAEKTVRTLRKAGVTIELADNGIARCGELTPRLHDLGLIDYFTQDGSDLRIPETVEHRFGVKVDDLYGMGDFIWGDRYCVASVSAWELKSTALWFYENYGRSELLTPMIKALARASAADSLPPVLAKAVEHWRLFRKRGLTGDSQAVRELRRKIERIRSFPEARVMILGESGTGKETVAMQLHYGSPRHDKKFVAFNCATVNAELLESRLFGYEKGAFTGADRRTRGLFEEADGGTLFLDEIGEMKPELQGVLLRAVEEGRILRVGGTEEFSVDVRLLTATNRDLPAMVRAGTFRADLYQRLSVVQIVVPPLREHKEDIPSIVRGWYSLRLRPNEKCPDEPTDEQVAALMDYDYPGNVRELLNVLDRAAMLGEKDWVKLMNEHRAMNRGLLPAPVGDGTTKSLRLEDAIRRHVQSVHEQCGGNITKTAEVLGVSRNTARKYV